MNWINKYIRASFNKKAMLEEITRHREIIDEANQSLEKLTLNGEDHWLDSDPTELECTLDTIKLKRAKNGTLTGITRAHCNG